ncbi:MAG: hypothetical protein ACREHD_21670, partial [Pirellulales bacterium]
MIFAPLQHARSMDDRAARIFQQSAQNIDLMRSVQFSASESTKLRQDGAEREFHDTMTFTFDKGRIRSEVELTDRNTGERLHYL